VKKTNKALLASTVVMAVIAVSAIPQAQAAPVETSKNSTAMLFQFNGLSDLSTSAYKGGFGIRHFIQDKVAIRPMIMVGMSSDKDKPVSEGDAEVKDTDTILGAELTVEKHANPIGSVSPYVGGQAGFSWEKMKREVDGTETGSTNSTNFGAGVVAGFVWGFSEGVTLGGEYSLSFSAGSGDQKNASGDKISDMSRTDIGIGTASLFLSVAWK